MKRFSSILALLGLTFIYSCQREKSFEVPGPTSPGSGGTAVFALQGTGGNCMNATTAGNYVSGTAVAASNTVTIEVDVTTAGSYNIHTATVNGFYFSGSGNFTATGLQTITLTATGTPSAQGSQVFTVVAGTSTCTFSVNVAAAGSGGGGGTTGNHFPLTANSWWSYEDTSSGDSTVRTNVSAVTIAGNTYRAFQEKDDTGIQDSVYFRKSGSDYFEYTWADFYSLSSFDNNVFADLPFLKEGLTTGATWNSPEYTGTMSGQNGKIRYVFNCTNANTTVTVGGQNFTNVTVINFKSQVSMLGSPYADEGLVWTVYYADGIGMIYIKAVLNGTTELEANILHYHVL